MVLASQSFAVFSIAVLNLEIIARWKYEKPVFQKCALVSVARKKKKKKR